MPFLTRKYRAPYILCRYASECQGKHQALYEAKLTSSIVEWKGPCCKACFGRLSRLMQKTSDGLLLFREFNTDIWQPYDTLTTIG